LILLPDDQKSAILGKRKKTKRNEKGMERDEEERKHQIG
jgi:hypothetical protein